MIQFVPFLATDYRWLTDIRIINKRKTPRLGGGWGAGSFGRDCFIVVLESVTSFRLVGTDMGAEEFSVSADSSNLNRASAIRARTAPFNFIGWGFYFGHFLLLC